MRNQLVPRTWRVTLFAALLALWGCNGTESAPESASPSQSASKSKASAPDGLGDIGGDFAAGVDAQFGVETFALTEPTLKIVFPTEGYRYEVDFTQTDPGDPAYADQLDATAAQLAFQVQNFAIGPTQGQILCWVNGSAPPYSTTSATLSNVALGLAKGMRTITCTLANAAGEPLLNTAAKANVYVQVTSIFGDEAPENRCFVDSECEDGNACSFHACVSQRCEYKPDLTCCLSDVECASGKVCLNPNTANAVCSACSIDGDCDDGNDCTVDTCDSAVTGDCKHTKTNPECCIASDSECDDGKECTVDACDTNSQLCSHTIPEGACCVDADCTTADPCLYGNCLDLECRFGPSGFKPGCCHSDTDCNDNNYCTLDKCDNDLGDWTQCTHVPDPSKSQELIGPSPIDISGPAYSGDAAIADGIPGRGQSFKAAESGSIISAEVWIVGAIGSSHSVYVALATMDGTPLAAPQAYTPPAYSGAPVKWTINFPTPIPVVAGTDYAVLFYAASPSTDISLQLGDNLYVNGEAAYYYGNLPNQTEMFAAQPGKDLRLKLTFATTVGETFTCCELLNSSLECNDGNACTYDVCNAYKCEHNPMESCCATAVDCDDSNPCTVDACQKAQLNDAAGKCTHTQAVQQATLPVTSGLAAHYDATTPAGIVKDGNNVVTAWNDLSGNGRNLSANGTGPTWTDAAINGKPALQFNGSNGFVSAPFPLTADSTVFFAFTYDGSTVWGSLGHHGGRDLDWAMEMLGSTNDLHFQSNNDNSDAGNTLTAGETYVALGRISSGTRNFALVRPSGDIATAGGAAFTLTPGNKSLYIGKSDSGEGINATIGEVVYYDRALTLQEYEAVANYLRLRWGVASEGLIDPATAKCCIADSDCNDGKNCTTDSCINPLAVNGGLCQNVKTNQACCDTATECDDGDVCTAQACVNNSCYYGPDGFKPNCCTDNGDCNDGSPCTVDACNLTTNTCEFVSNGDPLCCTANINCDDGDCTTLDFCNGQNQCEQKPDPFKCVLNSDCEDGDPCTIDSCDTSAACGQCKHELSPTCCSSDVECNDAVPSKAGATPNPKAACTIDRCVNNVCENTLKPDCCISDADATTVCDDDNACTIEYCLANTCRHTTPKGGCCATAADCNDGNTCTTDACGPLGPDGKGACQYQLQAGCTCTPAQVASGTNCNDNNPCTADSCVGGLCVNSAIAGCCVDKFDCSDGSPCTYDYCIFNQCVHSPTEGGNTLCCSPATENVDCAYLNTECAKGVCRSQGDGSFQCEAEKVPVCTVNIGYCQNFEIGNDLSAMGWNPGDITGTASSNWKVASNTGLGPDQAAKLDWTPTKIGYETCLQSPVIQAAGAQTITLQYDHEFLWNANETTVRLLGTLDGASADWSDSVLINQWSLTDNLGPETIDLTLPPELTGSNGLRLAFCVSGATTFDLQAFSLDNVCIVKGSKPALQTCPTNQIVPFGTLKTVPIKAFDPDFDAILSFSLVDAPPFVTVTSAMYYWLDTSWNANIRIQPTANQHVGTFPITVRVSDGALYSLCTFYVTVTYQGGYLVWRPSEVPEEMGSAIFDAIKGQTTAPVQHITNLGLYPNLAGFAGVFVTLGAYPNNHVLTTGEATQLGQYLNSAGRVYMEGGDTWAFDPQTSVHTLFQVQGVDDAAPEGVTGPLVGSAIYRDNFQLPNKIYQWGYNQSPDYNNLNDVIRAKQIKGARNLLTNANPVLQTVVQVGNNVPQLNYRTVASSVLFAGVEGTGIDQPADMITRVMQFFQGGYFDCNSPAQCDDGNSCTTDSCVQGECVNKNDCTCATGGGISCGQTVPVTSNAVGSTQALQTYGCDSGTAYTGKEFALLYTPAESGPVTVTISNLTNPNARIFATKANEGVCDAGQCLAWGNTSFTFPAAAGQAYYIILDVPADGVATADIQITCAAGEDCSNGIDDNGNGLNDCADLASCCGFAACGEKCDGLDNDCDGTIDNGCDDDLDGFCDADMERLGNPAVCPLGGNDCNDELATINPSVQEICSNGFDDNCSGGGDEENALGCTQRWADLDNDTYGAGPARCLCAAQGNYKATQAGDCNDASASVNPAMIEVCGNSIDDDCSGSQNDLNAQGCTEFYTDNDLDGFGVLPKKCQCFASGTLQTTGLGDCDDNNPSSFPGGAEACNGRDDDCDNQLDEGCDDDGDGYCDAGMGYEGIGEVFYGCNVSNTSVSLSCANGGTITSINAGFYGQPIGTCPGIAAGACDLGSALQTVKDLCLGQTSCTVNASPAQFGSDPCVGQAKQLAIRWTCTANGTPPPVCFRGGGDTADDDPNINPDGQEICDNKDNDSNGQTDEGCDVDGDDYCNASMVIVGAPSTCPKGVGDCNDADADINPGEAEDCNTPEDDDCDGDAVELNAQNCSIFFADGDGDGYGLKQFICACGPSGQYTAPRTGDCQDTIPSIYPTASEACDNIDNDCDASTDEGCDDDGDGYCEAGLFLQGSPAVCPNGGNDCADTNALVNPGRAELCGNGVDDNCNGSQNDAGAVGCTVYYADADGDSFGSTASQCLCQASGSFQVSNDDDCNDTAASVYPGAPEVCDGLDNNCNDSSGSSISPIDITAASYPNLQYLASGFGNAKDAAQTFTPASSGSVESVEVWVAYNYSTTNSVFVRIAEVSGASFNYVSPATAFTPPKPAGSYPTNPAEKWTITFPTAVPVSAGTEYAVVFYANGNALDMAMEMADEVYAGGTAAFATAIQVNDWADRVGKDMRMKISFAGSVAVAGVDEGCDDDQDGYCDANLTTVGNPAACPQGGGDCNDAVSTINPGVAVEVCDNTDNNCNSILDEGCDDDGDGYCDAAHTVSNPLPAICPGGGNDCDDLNNKRNPGAQELCGNSLDDNCNGSTNDVGAVNCKNFYFDSDGDTYGLSASLCLCTAQGSFTATKTNDCNDLSAAANPGATEVCGDGVDNDCDGDDNDLNAQGCNDFYFDDDQDGYGLAALKQCRCVASGDFSATQTGDCNDTAAAVRPNATEVCNNVDDNCAGGVDEGCNDDGDAFCDANMTTVGTPNVCALGGGDCNDAAALVNPTQAERCDNLDNNCNGTTDEGCDDDDDGFCDAGMIVSGTPATCALGSGDCNDTNNAIYPTAAEQCATTWDDNCDGQANNVGAAGCEEYGVDADGDTYNDKNQPTQCLCAPSGLYRGTEPNDCNDQNDRINPGIIELCDGIDNDCDGTIDEQCDQDGDDYCDAGRTTVGKPAVCPNGGGDCNDASSAISPGAQEVCANAVDENCDGQLNSRDAANCTNYFLDGDNDGYAVNVSECWCVPTGGYKLASASPADCDDSSATTNPAATEVCGDGLDNDCDGSQNDTNATGCVNFYQDGDLDGYGTGAAQCRCFAQGAYTTSLTGDCLDSNALVNPGEVETCDGADNNCNGTGGAVIDQVVGSVSQVAELVGAGTYSQGFQVGQTGKLHSVRFMYRNTGAAAGATINAIRGGSAIATVAISMPNAANFTEFTATFATKPDVTTGEQIVIQLVPTGTLSSVSLARDNANPYPFGNAALGASQWTTVDLRFSTYVSNIATSVDEGCDDDNDDFCDAQMVTSGSPAVCPNGGGDCNDNLSATRPNAAEVCNNLDDNCQGLTDEGCDDDNDNYCDANMTKVGTPATCTSAGSDCDDQNAQINAGKAEICDGVDNNCNSQVDEGCDDDGDDYCDSGMVTVGTPAACPLGGGDCADGLAARNPGAAEICDGIDNNCTGGTDETCRDSDGDGYCVGNVAAGGPCVNGGNDCDDTRNNVNPGATETCSTSYDDNCNGNANEVNATACQNFYADNDLDGYGAGAATCQCIQSPGKVTLTAGDCNDSNANINPAKLEICDGVNNDCAGTPAIDGGCDDDGDTFCDATMLIASTATCAGSSKPAAGATKPGDDCNDGSNAVRPNATEQCDNLDNNCNGSLDEGCDDDGDDYCDSGMTRVGTPATCPNAALDCNDNNKEVNPGKPEICSTAEDDNCDGQFTALNALGCTTYYQDSDNDSWGTNISQCHCAPSGTFKATQRVDCNDGDASVFPSTSAEVCDNKDNNCNGVTDEGCDIDKDGYCGAGLTVTSNASCPSTPANSVGNDCGPSDSLINPGRAEICNNLDDNCNGQTDEGCDDDDDNYCDAAMVVVGAPTTCSAGGGDCADAAVAGNNLIRPGGTETCNSKDDNCNGLTDEAGSSGCATRYFDGDQDGYGVASNQCLCAPTGLFTSSVATDCNDGCPTCFPGGTEVCDGFDNNCASGVDEGCNADNDGYCTSAKVTIGKPPICTLGGGDCNDSNGTVRPLATEACNGVDDDCDGTIDEQAAAQCTQLPNTQRFCGAGGAHFWFGNCTYTCLSGYSNNNGWPNDGCEVRNF